MNVQTLWVTSLDQLSIQPTQNRADWLTKPTILSQALRRVSQTLSVKLLSQKWDTAFDHEYPCLQLEQKPLLLIRKIFLQANEIPLVYGRVIIAPSTYHHHAAAFDSLGESPLGETLLYHNPDVTRSQFEFAVLEDSHALFQEISLSQVIQAPLFARRSVFWIKQAPLLVTEIFLPALPAYCDE